MKRFLGLFLGLLLLVGCGSGVEYTKGEVKPAKVTSIYEEKPVQADVILDEVSKSGEKLKVKFTIKNVGSEPVDISGVQARGSWDKSSKTEIKSGRLSQGESATGMAELDGVVPGKFTITIGPGSVGGWAQFDVNIK